MPLRLRRPVAGLGDARRWKAMTRAHALAAMPDMPIGLGSRCAAADPTNLLRVPVARGDLKRELVVADADVVAVVQRGRGTDPLVLHMHPIR